jgi:hypothetical protein
MQRADYLSALLRGWWLIAVLALVGLAVGLLLPKASQVGTTHWSSTSSFGSAPPATSGSSSLFGGGISTDQIIYYGDTDAVMAAASQFSHLNQPIWEIRQAISLAGPPSANSSASTPTSNAPGVVDVKVQEPTSALALALNQGYDEAMEYEIAGQAKEALDDAEMQTETTLQGVEKAIYTQDYPAGLSAAALEIQVSALQNYLATLVVTQPNTGFQILQAPADVYVLKVTSTSPLSSRPVRALVGLAIGLILGALAAVALWLLDGRLKTAKRAQAAFGYPVVGEIPSRSSDATEPYRMLWLSVFREPLPLPPADDAEGWFEGENPVLESGVGSRSTP